MPTRISDSQRRRIFGAPGRPELHVMVMTPWGLKVRTHRLVAARFLAACEVAHGASSWKPKRIDSYANRTVRGSTSVSLHAYALGWDFFNRAYPEPVDVWGPTNAPDRAFRDSFSRLGFAIGADFTRRRDVPHIEWAAGTPPVAVPSTVFDPAPPIPEPLVKPIIHSRYAEVLGMRVSTHFVTIPALDNNGRGWVDLPVPVERVMDVIAQGSSPPDDGVYWPPVICTYQPRNGITRVTLAGKPQQATGVWWKLLEEQ